MSESSPHPFHGSIRKTDRAITHLHSLQGQIKSFFDEEAEPLRAVSKVDVKTSRYLMRVVIDRPFPDWWGLIVGDFVQNLRAALDHLVCRLLYADDREPTKRNAFPIFDQLPAGDSRRTWNGMVAGLDAAAVSFIERCQPYHRGNGPRGHTLHALRELSNEDKHRLLLPAVAAIKNPGEQFFIDVVSSRDVGPVQGGKLYSEYALKNGDLVLEAPVEITGPNPEVKTDANFTLDIGFGREPVVPLKGLVQMLDSVVATVHLAAWELKGFEDPTLRASTPTGYT